MQLNRDILGKRKKSTKFKKLLSTESIINTDIISSNSNIESAALINTSTSHSVYLATKITNLETASKTLFNTNEKTNIINNTIESEIYKTGKESLQNTENNSPLTTVILMPQPIKQNLNSFAVKLLFKYN